MIAENSIDRKYSYALSQVFSPSLLNKINDTSHEDNFKSLLYSCNLYPTHKEWDFVYGLELTYNYLKQNYRCEYVYKNEIANQLLLKYHSDNSATLLKEVNSDTSIADIVIVNGNTVAYEIKTELDSFDRLSGQIESYKMLYDSIYIVTHQSAVSMLTEKLDDIIGIIVLNDDGFLHTVRNAQVSSSNFNPLKAVLTLRQSELINAYEKYVGKMPKMGSAYIYNYCYEWFIKLDRSDSHCVFAEALKSRKPSSQQFALIKACKPSLKMLFLSKPLSKKYCTQVQNKLGIFE